MTAGMSGPERELRATRPTDPPRIPLSAVAERLGVPAPQDDPVVTGVSLGSSRVLPGDLYAALPGARAHGASYAAQAIERGAVAVLTDADGAAMLGDAPGARCSSSSRRAGSSVPSPPTSTAGRPRRCG